LTLIFFNRYEREEVKGMIKNFDHVTVVVRDLEKAKAFFKLLGFKEDKSVVISGDVFSLYMGIDNIEAEHVTLVLPNATPRMEVQILKYRHPEPISDQNITKLNKLGYNHVCFAVDNIEKQVRELKEQGITTRNQIMDFHSRKLVYIFGPEDITVELAEWY
jgi:catechol 2,3-dioxygenase-like lactoylglutathione lyase family enzyme